MPDAGQGKSETGPQGTTSPPTVRAGANSPRPSHSLFRTIFKPPSRGGFFLCLLQISLSRHAPRLSSYVDHPTDTQNAK